MRPIHPTSQVGSDEFLLQIVGKKLAATAIGEDKAIIFKSLGLKMRARKKDAAKGNAKEGV